MKILRRTLALKLGRVPLCCFFLLSSAFMILLAAPEFKIENYTIDATGRVRLRHTADVNSYYILFRGAEVTSIGTAADMALGVNATSELRDAQAISPTATGFYRIQRVALAQPLDTDKDGIDDVYELRRATLLNPLNSADAGQDFDGDGTNNLEEFKRGTDPAKSDVVSLTTISSSPANGEQQVSVTRETIIRFSTPLAEGATIGPNQLYAEFGGRRMLSRVELASDRQTATLFYLEPLPGSARIRVHLDTSNVLDAQGRAVDANGDGTPGGMALIDFDTVSQTLLPNTVVFGRVFASELAAPSAGNVSVNTPLAGVIVTADGLEETVRATTDQFGNFRLTNAPAGPFFVHIDGRPIRDDAKDIAYPEKAYYPYVGKLWESTPGREVNIGEIYLPLVSAGTLRPLSANADTTVTFPVAVVTQHPELQGVSITVPANSLFSDNGQRGGMVGIAPVPPDRLPGPLPAGLEFPLVITVQTDGAANFDRPVPACFPNLPDPTTKQPLAPGTRNFLYSFNHDTGQFEAIGPMTVSEDGKLICTDPGVGILAPGWHGSGPVPIRPPPPP